tara:strand:- start:4291 stop:4869 length:579 start_codon:yes stop_codon:yes gene_type:complete
MSEETTPETATAEATPEATPAPQLDLGLAPEVASVQAAPEPAPEPEPAPAPKAKSVKAKKSEADELAAQLRGELAAAKEAREALEATRAEMRSIVDHNKDNHRLSHLRAMGAIDAVPDGELLKLAPQVDVNTLAGRVKLEEWRSSVPTLFSQVETPKITAETLTSNVTKMVEGRNYWNEGRAAEFFKRNLKG